MECDFLVIGSGASGSVVGGRLAEKNDNVIVAEAGGWDNSAFIRLPGLGFYASAISKFNWNFVADLPTGLNKKTIDLFQGKVLGGSSSINGMIYTRGHSSEYNKWLKMGCLGWGFQDLLPYFIKLENHFRGAGKWHGDKGPIKLKKANPNLPICNAFLESASSAGFPIVDDLNSDCDEGLGWYDVNINNGLRISSFQAYLKPNLKKKNLRVLANTFVNRINFFKGKAVSVDAISNGKIIQIKAHREIIISAGAIKTPQLLMVSGIGPKDHLSEFKIPVLVDSPKIGKNFQNHPCYRPFFDCNEAVTARNYVNLPSALKAGFNWVNSGTGPLAESFASVGGFFKSNQSLPVSDMQVVLLSAIPSNSSKGFFDMLPKSQGFGMTIYQGSPYSRGEVILRSSDPMDNPIINSGYFSDERDIKIFANGVERILEIINKPPIAKLISHKTDSEIKIRNKKDLIEKIKNEFATSYHQCGTCVMGIKDEPLDLRLRVRGVKNLRVADTSIIPRLPNAALHAPALLIGEKAAEMILEDQKF